MTAPLSDRADRLKRKLAHLIDDHRATINRATDIQATLKIDGKKIVQPWFDDIVEHNGPDALADLDDVEKEIVQALAESEEPLTIEKLEEKSGHSRSAFYGKNDRLRRLQVEGVIIHIRQRGYKLTTFGREIAAAIEAEES